MESAIILPSIHSTEAVQTLILFCKYGVETYALKVGVGDGFNTVLDRIHSRWVGVSKSSSRLYYSIVGRDRCGLRTEDDYLCMVAIASSTGVSLIDVDVVAFSSQASSCEGSSSSYIDNNANAIPEHENYLLTSGRSSKKKVLRSNDWDKSITHVGQKFEGGAKEFRLCLEKLELETGFEGTFLKNTPDRVKVVCAHRQETGCSWMISASKEPINKFFYVKKMQNIHSCGASFSTSRKRKVSSELVANLVTDQLRDKPGTRPIDVLHQMRNEYGMPVSYINAYRGVHKAKEVVFGDLQQSFGILPWYTRFLQETDSRSHVVLEADNVTRRFKRLFIAFGACVEGFNHCRPFLSIDGTHLKGQYKGKMLAAIGKDGDQGLYPLCVSVVDSENDDNWMWFFMQLKCVLDLHRPITFISDRNSGLIKGVETVFPLSPHCFCLQHLKTNLQDRCRHYHVQKHMKEHLVQLFSKCAYAPTVELFKTSMDAFMLEGRHVATDFLHGLDPRKWANAYFEGKRFVLMCSNSAESFNSWIREERELPVSHLVDTIRKKLMHQFAERRDRGKSWASDLCPYADRTLSSLISAGRSWRVIRSTEHVFEVNSSPSVVVDIGSRVCSCRQWEICGLPCDHALAVIQTIGDPLLSYVDYWFTSEAFCNSYKGGIATVPFMEMPPNVADAAAILPPYSRRPPGRPKKKRIPSRGEEKRLITCGRCGKKGHHNQKTCVDPVML